MMTSHRSWVAAMVVETKNASMARQRAMSSTCRGKARRKLCAPKADSWAGSAKVPVRACIDRLGASAPASPRSAAGLIVMLPKVHLVGLGTALTIATIKRTAYEV